MCTMWIYGQNICLCTVWKSVHSLHMASSGTACVLISTSKFVFLRGQIYRHAKVVPLVCVCVCVVCPNISPLVCHSHWFSKSVMLVWELIKWISAGRFFRQLLQLQARRIERERVWDWDWERDREKKKREALSIRQPTRQSCLITHNLFQSQLDWTSIWRIMEN